jgi:hypothetical protein
VRGAAHQDHLADGERESPELRLGDVAEGPGQPRTRPAGDGLAVGAHHASARLEEPEEGLEERRLPAAVGAEKAEALARLPGEGHALAHRLPWISEGEVLDADAHRYCQARRETASSQTKTGTPTNAVSTPGGTSMGAMVRPTVSTARR